MPLREVGDALVLAAAFFVLTAVLTVGLTWLVRYALMRRDVMDRPNERSSHAVPVPRGGGLAVILVLIPVCAAFGLLDDRSGGTVPLVLPWTWIVAAAALAAISFRDDLQPLSPSIRLLSHAVAVIVGLPALMSLGSISQEILPPWADIALAGLLWVGFLNFFNFMDGIDGITAVETIAIGFGLAVIGTLSGLWVWLGSGVVLAGVAAGFLFWNRPPAKVFLGDVGSVPLGYLLGGLLLTLAAMGFWAAAVILPAYYLADAGLTLVKRLMRGERIWEAHRSHFYQHAARVRGGHAPVTCAVAIGNALLVVAAYFSLTHPWVALAAAAAIVGLLLLWMARS